jgi:hypothetical protein
MYLFDLKRLFPKALSTQGLAVKIIDSAITIARVPE